VISDILSMESIHRRIHPSLGGIALGSVGLAGAFRAMCEVHEFSNGVEYVSLPLNVVSVCCAIAVCLRAVWCRDVFMKEIIVPSSNSAYGSLVMALALIFKDLADSSEEGTFLYGVAAGGIYVAAALQFIVMVLFFEACWRTCTYPEPFWFPPTVSLAMTGWSGMSINMERVIVELSFWGGVVLCVLILPVAIYRVCTEKRVASHPSIGILQAPSSFLTCAWFGIQGSEWVGGDDLLLCVLFSASTIVFVLTVASVLINRDKIFESFSPWFAGK